MRILSGLVAVLSIFVCMLATTAWSMLSALDGVDFAWRPLVQGDLRPIFTSATFWRGFPCCSHVSQMLAFLPAAVVLSIGALLLAAARRWRRVPNAVWALCALWSGSVPFAIGAIALRDNVVEPDTGPWLAWMVAGPAYAALLACLFLMRGALPRFRQPAGSSGAARTARHPAPASS